MHGDCHDLSKDTTEACHGTEDSNVKYSWDIRLRLVFVLHTYRSPFSDIKFVVRPYHG
jgi:hypothetical protein